MSILLDTNIEFTETFTRSFLHTHKSVNKHSIINDVANVIALDEATCQIL